MELWDTRKEVAYFLVQDHRPTVQLKSYSPIGIFDNIGDGIVQMYRNPPVNSLYVVEKNPCYCKSLAGGFCGEIGVFYHRETLRFLNSKTLTECRVSEASIMTPEQARQLHENLSDFLYEQKDDILKNKENIVKNIEKYTCDLLEQSTPCNKNAEFELFLQKLQAKYELIQTHSEVSKSLQCENDVKIRENIRYANILNELKLYYTDRRLPPPS